MKRWPKNSIVNDIPKRRAMIRFLKGALPRKGYDGRMGLLIAASWEYGYESARRRFRDGERHGD